MAFLPESREKIGDAEPVSDLYELTGSEDDRLTPICKLWTKNPQIGYIVERHLWTKNPHEIKKLVFGNVVERHLWTKNPHKFFFKKIKNLLLGISCSVICGQKNHIDFLKYMFETV